MIFNFFCFKINQTYDIRYLLFTAILIFVFHSCSKEGDKLFTQLDSNKTNIDFENNVVSSFDFNIMSYLYFYDGAGVSIGDINNDGLPDIYFVGNETKNKLYLNKGDFVFEDITEPAGVAGESGSWSKGVTMADINGDGFLDIYVSQVNYLSKKGANQLFINNGDGTFTESASKYGLDFKGYSTQAIFFDYDKDGLLDLFLLNHPPHHSERTQGRAQSLRKLHDPNAGDRLFRNEGGKFIDVTSEANIYKSALGYGLGVAVSDINKDGWLDIYVGNDFHEDDYLYLNNGDGTFTEALYKYFGHTSRSSMGNDIADITNNGYVDVISVDMMPEDHENFMRSGGPDKQNEYNRKLELGYGHQYARNTLQINRGSDPSGHLTFSETAYLSGVARTDWSWASLLMDLNNDGYKDLFISNGIYRRPNDLDADRKQQSFDMMPQLKLPNYAFQNNGDLTFTNMAEKWGLNQPSFSSGVAYADLNNNGRLDLVVNNVNMPAFIYKNITPETDSLANYLKIKLKGAGMNTSGIGSKVILYKDEQIFYQEQIPTRGFQSSVDHVLHFGLGGIVELDSLKVIWTDDRYQSINDVSVNQLLELRYESAAGIFDYSKLHSTWDESTFIDVTDEISIDFRHRENSFIDYSNDPLIPYKLSTQGPALATGDINGNGLNDVFIGGASGQAGVLFIQLRDGSFEEVNLNVFESDIDSEDVDAAFFDATGNGLQDLYVVSGGGQFTGVDDRLKDRLYINMGNGHYKKSIGRLPDFFENGSVVRPMDYNGDGHVDLFVGGRSVPFSYGLSPSSFLFENDGEGNFFDVTKEVAPELSKAGMTTDAQWSYISNHEYPDLVVTAEWSDIQYFRNTGEKLVYDSENVGLANTGGLWQSLLIDDFTGNGQMDIIAGNFGLNTRIRASTESPFRLYNIDDNGMMAPVMAEKIEGDYYPFEQLDELLLQFDFLTREINSYEDYSNRTMYALFKNDVISFSEVHEITELRTTFFKNNGNGSFINEDLPIEVQFSPVTAMHSVENNEKMGKDVLLGGNHFDVRPSIGGRQDGSLGAYLQWTEEGFFQSLNMQSSGFYLKGEIREIREVKTPEGNLIFIAQNNDGIKIFKKRR